MEHMFLASTRQVGFCFESGERHGSPNNQAVSGDTGTMSPDYCSIDTARWMSFLRHLHSIIGTCHLLSVSTPVAYCTVSAVTVLENELLSRYSDVQYVGPSEIGWVAQKIESFCYQ
eukprot:TRINITY_DN26885_c0_g1_i1.p1 TRINITY_DN26885_c0_g1~~TRINITY_DN26885_c0_g1_i1.p1  ORF type:complete len:116 (+),score=9.87 TRINITY_DN26885_c0_g1_i1:128-475(+)